MKVTATYDFEVSDADMEKAVAKAVEKQLLTDPDLVQVVRCRDCKYATKAKWNKKGYRICPASHMEIMDDDFCSYGERKGGETDGS